jgi:tetratricopeptide (TPR) repeat protein
MVSLVMRRGWLRLILVLAGISFVIALLLPVLEAWTGPSLERSRRAYNRGDWSEAAAISGRILERSPGDPEAIRLRARGLARLGRGREALALDALLGSGRLQAEDLFLIGRELNRDGPTILGWAALNAASKLDPKHRETIDTLAATIRRVEAPGQAVGQADRLVAVPNGEALAELVVGLWSVTRAGQTPGDLDPMLDRVLRRDRATLLKIDSPSAAQKFLARILLEDGRADEACAWLDKVAGRADPEMNWLLSRALLDRGEIGNARAALKRAGNFGLDNPLALEPARYVGAKQCADCHAEIYRVQQESRHASTIAWGGALKSVPLPKGEVKDPEEPGVVHRFDRTGHEVRVTADVHGQSATALIDYALGSGHHGVTMLARDASGRHRSLRISYYARGEHWGLTSGFDPHPNSPEKYIGEPLNEESFRNCLNCHSTRFTSERDRGGPEVADRGIGCERCHGPGDHHLRAVEADFPQLAIARPKLATPAQRLNLCAQCHGSDGVIPPSDPRFIRFQAATLPYSRCVTESGGRLDCVACHDPHRNLETDPVSYEMRCLACHGGGKALKGREPGLRLEAVSAARCPVNEAADCVKCHMPKVDEIMPFMSFTDHHIRIHHEAGSAEKAVPHP